ncbi:mannosyltransferase [Artomyces pyxidatus]|uniref:Mannosyltransferase n=1 Tax=Artomyces pyxidatus TaxID=48021 RepID=A0ACB8T5X3_9AGAM|nr:mannosyltransferase [Artomyces pyxidatus]
MSSQALRSRHLRLLAVFTALSHVATALLLYFSARLPLFDSAPRTLLPPPQFPSFTSALLRWDTFHFAAIAEHGYAYEHQWAFFPGTPFLVRAVAYLFRPIDTVALLRAGALAGLACSLASPYTLYDLTRQLFPRSPSFAFLAALLSLLPLSPTTLYFAAYAEPAFTLLSYKGMLACARKQHLRASLYFALAASFRSNGILLAMYVPWDIIVEPFLKARRLPAPGPLFRAAAYTALPLVPSLAHQYTAYRLFCHTPAPVLPDWCTRTLPSIYTHVQRTYWRGNGFLAYWTLAQLPNILLALPVLVLLLWWALRTLIDIFTRQEQYTLAPHALHTAALALTLLFAAHTQIALRLAPSLPATCWAGASLLTQPATARIGRAWVAWSVVWGAVSIVLWATGLPPA